MATSSFSPRAGTPAPVSRLVPWLRVAALAATLAGLPLLASKAGAQQPAAIRASAYVSHSILDAVVRTDSPASARGQAAPATEQLRIAGVGLLDVQTGPGEAVRVGRAEDARGDATVTVQVLNVGS